MKKIISEVGVMLIALSTSSGLLINAQNLPNNNSQSQIDCSAITADGVVDETCPGEGFGIEDGGFERGGTAWTVTNGYPTYIGGYDNDKYEGLHTMLHQGTAIYQEFSVQPGEKVYYSFAHRGSFGVDQMELRGGVGSDIDPANPTTGGEADTILTMNDGTEWHKYVGSYTIPTDWDPAVPYRVAFLAVSTAGGVDVGNPLDEVHLGTEAVYDNEINVETSDALNTVSVTDKLTHLEGDVYGKISRLTITNDQNFEIKLPGITVDGDEIDPTSIETNEPGKLVLVDIPLRLLVSEGDATIHFNAKATTAKTAYKDIKFTSKFEFTSFAEEEVLTQAGETVPLYTVEDNGTGSYEVADKDNDGISDQDEIDNGLDPDEPNLGDLDNDGLSDKDEVNIYGTDPLKADTDDDKINDGEEINSTGTDPLNPDTDNDGLIDGREIELGTDPLNPDTDNDGILDGPEVDNGLDPLIPNLGDLDNDGLTDKDEVNTYGTDPLKADTDGDEILDKVEIDNGLDPLVPNLGDLDNDGLTDRDEVNFYGTDPLNPDTDNDGINDGDEVNAGMDPLSDDSDKDGITDKDEIDNGLDPLVPNLGDLDNDGLTDKDEVNTYGTNPHNPDTDHDGISDGDEVANGLDPLVPNTGDTDKDGITDKDEVDNGLNPLVANLGDIDGDGLTDKDEVNEYKTNPLNTDTDNDGINDKSEIDNGLDPLVANTGDTDNDGLTDFDEINKYHTDPLNSDTDGDEISDKDEIENGLNPDFPNTGDTDGDGISDKDEVDNGTDPLIPNVK